MEKGSSIKDWIKAGEIAKKFKRKTFFGVGIQTKADDGSYIVVIFVKTTKAGIKGGLRATQKDIDKLKELGVPVTDKGNWLSG